MPAGRQHHHPSRHRRDGRRSRAAQARRPRYRRHRRWRRPRHPRRGRHPRRAVQVAGLGQPHQRRPGHHRRAPGAQAPRRDRPPARPVARGVRAQGPARGLPRAASAGRSSPTRWRDGPSSTRSPRSARPSAPSPRPAARCGPSACAASARRNTLPDRPEIRGMIARVPHLITRRGRSSIVKVHDLKPAAGLHPQAQARRSRHRRQGRQDRRPWHQGPRRPRHHPRRLRGRPAAAAHAGPQAQGLQEPVPGRVPGPEPRCARGVRPRRRSIPSRSTSRGLTHKGALIKVLGRGEVTRPIQVQAHAFSRSAEAAITAAGGTVETLPLPWGDRRPPAKGNHLTNR